ncbi:SprT-like domain-containing protein [Cognataquiflexum rubidum]|uniref:SprT-like domain-containing protein n=1 Tax=Cognataquiflexum rubidum TaxID=2922273 RepID=UPI001F1346D8|nr:SprT-like domain-containing protein [Cognataquiflexum rubidum]MCH6236654.1 SprT-like domain-containing protein [Cognataquiflexum rubidum]
MDKDQAFLKAFQKHVPLPAAEYCWNLWKELPFNFYITRTRQTKLGDFRYRRDQKIQTITINHDLNPYQFLITYVHEVAHFRAFEKYGLNIKPHGPEWKIAFRNLMTPLLSDQVFPKDVLIPLKRHFINPKASSGSDLFLSKAVKKYDGQKTDGVALLVDLIPGEIFELKGRAFKKEAIRRTRVLCQEVDTGRKYLISAHAEVKKIDKN